MQAFHRYYISYTVFKYFHFAYRYSNLIPNDVSILGVNGCFIKLSTGQQILAATGRDGNNNIYPIAFGIVDKEDTDSWTWFLSELKICLGGESRKVWVLYHYIR